MSFRSFGDSAKEDRDYTRVRLKIDGGYDKHGDVFVIARPLTGSVSFPVKTFDDAKAREQFIEEFTFFRYGGQCPSWGSVLFANDCFSGEEKYSDTLKGENYTSERGKAYVLQLVASGELVIHCTGSWIPPGDRNHHLPWPTKPKEKEEFLPVVDHRSYALGPHDGPGSEHPEKTRTRLGGKVVPDKLDDIAGSKLWNQKTEFGGRKIFQRNDLFDPHAVDGNGLANIQRMQKGQAPKGFDGEPVNLHHLTGNEPGSVAEVGGKLHSDETKMLHIQQQEKVNGEWVQRKNYSFRAHDGRKSTWPLTKSGKVQRTDAEKAFIKWSSDYWKNRARGY